MLINKKLLGILLLVIMVLVFSVNGFATSYYKFTQESGTLFYVSAADKSDALEDTNELRQIVSDLGALLVHNKKNDLYPKDLTTGGTLQIPEAGLKFSNAPVNDDLAAYIAGEMTWQTKAELSIQPLDTALTNISALTYVSPSLIKLTGDDTYAVRTLAEVKTDLAYQLSDMSDVGVTTPTDTYVLVADGDSWESRALVEADISDLGDYATLTGDEVLTNKDINLVNALGSDHTYSGELDSQPVGESVVFGDLLYFNWAKVTGTDIAFVDGGAGEDTITQVAARFLEIGLVAGDVITVTGSTSNNGNFTIISVVAGTINVATASLVAEAAGASVTITSPYEWKKAKADVFATAKATRIALESKANGETCLILVKGYIRDDSAFDFGAARVFLNDDVAGTCDDTAPAETGDQIFVVGEAKSADILFFDPGKDVGEI